MSKPCCHRSARGSAMIETVLAMPFLLVIFAFVLFFGQNFIRVQKAASFDRYESWRSQAYAPGPEAEASNPLQDQADGFADGWRTGQLNDAFFGNDPAATIAADITTSFPDDAYFRFTQRVTDAPSPRGPSDPTASDLVARMWFDRVGGLPRGRQVRLSTSHAATTPFEEELIGPLRHRFTRPDGDWRFANNVIDVPNELWYDRRADEWLPLYQDFNNLLRLDRRVSPSPYIRDFYFTRFDAEISGIASVNPLATTVRDFYLRIPAYHGPKLPVRWSRTGGYEY